MSYLRTAILLAGLTALFMLIGYLIGGPNGAVIAFFVAAATNFITYWNADKLVLSTQGAQEVDEHSAPELVHMVAELAQRAELPMPRVFVMDNPQPNAFATGRNPQNAAVCCTEGILQLLTPRELRGVLGHELMHVYNRDILTSSVAAAVAGVITSVGQMLLFFGGGDRRNSNPLALIAMALLAPLAASLIQVAISRTREYDADEDGSQLTGDPLALASALRKIHQGVQAAPLPQDQRLVNASHLMIANPFRGGGLSRLFATHPPMQDRISRLERMAGRPLG